MRIKMQKKFKNTKKKLRMRIAHFMHFESGPRPLCNKNILHLRAKLEFE